MKTYGIPESQQEFRQSKVWPYPWQLGYWDNTVFRVIRSFHHDLTLQGCRAFLEAERSIEN